VPLATAVTSYLSLFTVALNSAVGRYLTIALERGDGDAAGRIFNTSFWGSLAVVLVLLGPSVWLAYAMPRFVRVPLGGEPQLVRLMMASLAAFHLTTLSSAFGVSTFCRNRFDLANIVAALGNVVRVGVVVALFALYGPRLGHVGIGMASSAAIIAAGSVFLWRRLTPMFFVRLADFRLSVLRELTGTGGYSLT